MTSALLRLRGPGKLAAAATMALAMIGPAHGQPQPPGPSPAAPPPAPKIATKSARLDSTALAASLADPGSIAFALDAAREAGPAAKKLAPLIEEKLARGLPADLAEKAILALGALGAESSSHVIAPYLSHRTSAIRQLAAENIKNTGGPDAERALSLGLRSSHAEVRAASARGLRHLGSAAHVPDLLRALDRGEIEAAPAIAALSSSEQCRDLVARWDRLSGPDAADSGVEARTLEALLTRKTKLPDDLIVAAVTKAAASKNPRSLAYLRSLKKPVALSPRVRDAIKLAISEGKERSP